MKQTKQLPQTLAPTALPSLTRWVTPSWVGVFACGLAVSAAVCAPTSAARAQRADRAERADQGQAHAHAQQTRAAAPAQAATPKRAPGKATPPSAAQPPQAAQAKDTPATKKDAEKPDAQRADRADKKAGQDKAANPSKAAKPAASHGAPAQPAQATPTCALGENEQPRGGRLDVVGERFSSAPVVRIAGKPARILVRKQDRISVQVPVDSDGGEISLQDEGKVSICGELVIIGKNR